MLNLNNFNGLGSLSLPPEWVQKIDESMVGRKRLFELSTVSFEEFVGYRTGNRYEGNLLDFLEIEKERAGLLLMEYLQYGGYPRIVMATEQQEKLQLMDEIYRSVLEKDIAYLLKLDKPDVFSALIRVLASQIGQLLNYSELSSTLNVSFQTVKNYLWYARKIFLVEVMAPYARNVKKEISKAPVPYFWDLGLRNHALGLFGQIQSPSECGFVFENLVFLLLREKLKYKAAKLNFWRTTDKAEVDFVIDTERTVTPVEAKYKHLRKAGVPASLRSFISKYQPENAYIINLSLRDAARIDNTMVHFLPFHHLLGPTIAL